MKKRSIKNSKLNQPSKLLNKQDEDGNSPLLIACLCKDIKLIQPLIKLNADINLQNKDGYTPLIVSVDNPKILKYLLEHGANPDIQTPEGYTALIVAADYGYIKSVKLLIQHKADINLSANGVTPLMKAAFENHENIVKVLLKNGADVNVNMYDYKNNSTLTAFKAAFINKNYNIMNILAENGANILCEETNADILILSASKGHKQILKRLLEEGLDPNTEYNGLNVLSVAVQFNQLEIVEILIKNHIDMNKVGFDGITPLIETMGDGRYDIAKLLIQSGADINLESKACVILESKEHFTTIFPLMMAAAYSIEILQLLLDHNAEIDKQNEFGYTALIVAVMGKKNEALKLLLENGADTTLQLYNFDSEGKENGGGYSALNFAIDNNNIEAIKLILKTRKVLTSFEAMGLTLLSYDKEIAQIISGILKGIGKEYLEELFQECHKKGTLNLHGHLDFNEEKYSIKVNGEEAIFFDEFYKFEKFQKDPDIRNRYVNGNSYFELSTKKIIHGMSGNKPIEYEVDYISRNPIEIDDNHYPKRLVEVLNLFTQDNPIKYTAHSFEWSSYGSYESFINEVKIEYKKIENDLSVLSPNLHTKINKFLFDDTLNDDNTWGMNNLCFGWSSPELKEWSSKENLKTNAKKAINFPSPKHYQKEINHKTLTSFDDICDVFKNEIEIRDDDKLVSLFELLEEDVLGFDDGFEVEYINLEGISFYTDVENFKYGLTLIFEQFKVESKKQYKNIRVEAITDIEHIDVKITQVDSYVSKTKEEMKKEVENGNFQDIKNYFTSLCDWSIETKNKDKSFRVDYLSADSESENLNYTGSKSLGFTHILRFYTCKKYY